ncbi:SpoIID/LytB domain-containing protein [Paenibacillus cremeus]|uniref:SpoIID/LytB domain-containing protein n=2 Tax=Paenibacillus cremeus TaxID=2163881 RepID=A0A559KIW9_9BACL|nr:SpoIID/LytB domain-containing protein [Paenibacillus cremeus]
MSGGLVGAKGWTSFGGGPATAEAAVTVPKLDQIRVALFIDTGKYSDTVAAVTLSAAAGLQLSLRSAGGAKPVYTAAAKEPVRVYADGFYAQLPETGDAAKAGAQAQKLAAAGKAVGIVQRTKQGKPAYQVYLGPFATKEAASAEAAAQAGAAVSGPQRLSAGTYAGAAEAQAQAAAIAQAGFDADVALLDAGEAGAAAYAVLVGGAVDAAALQALKAQLAAALPAVALAPVDAAQGYALQRSELAVTADGTVPATGFAVGGPAKLWATTAAAQAADGVTVLERAGRSYRGGIELSRLNGKLAVINELPFEEYLYSVVSSELSKAWPLEALKAQAVAARTYALKQGVKYQIAHVTDTTLDQAYKGQTVEFPTAVQAVQATQGEVLADKSGLISPLFYSNAGGMTAESTEVWGNAVAYLKSMPSPDDGAEEGKKLWYRIVLPNGSYGYIHSDYARDTGLKNPAGLPYYESTGTGVSVRPAPYVDNAGNPAIFKVDIGDRFVVIDQVKESNAYSWIRGPFDASKAKDKLGSALPAGTGAIDHLEVSKRGPSGRALEVSANGQPLKAAYPDALRTMLWGLPSTRFEIEETGRYTILGADGKTRSQTSASPSIYAASGSNPGTEQKDSQLFVMDKDGKVRVATKSPQFIFRGTGLGHGLGMSQWGAKGYAELGYDYQKILQTYYVGVSIVKG